MRDDDDRLTIFSIRGHAPSTPRTAAHFNLGRQPGDLNDYM
jgi:hypothetical protein